MAKLMDDPKVQALVEKAGATATKAEFKRVTTILKDEMAAQKEAGNKVAAAALKNAIAALKEAA